MPGGAKHRHPDLTPPELFPIGDTGGDGEHYGYVVHAPELGWDDYPLASLVPGESDGAVPIGDGTMDAVANLAGFYHAERPLDADEREVLDRLGVPFDPARGARVRPLVGGDYARIEPRFPDGWRHVMMFDRIGVAAPAALFGDDPLETLPRATPSRIFLERAETALARGWPAAALFYLKLGRDGADVDDAYGTVLERLWETYRAMGRGIIGPTRYDGGA